MKNFGVPQKLMKIRNMLETKMSGDIVTLNVRSWIATTQKNANFLSNLMETLLLSVQGIEYAKKLTQPIKGILSKLLLSRTASWLLGKSGT